MYDRFRELGIPVKMTRTSDITLDPSVRPKRVLDQFGSGKDVVVISNHINAGGERFTYHYKFNWVFRWLYLD